MFKKIDPIKYIDDLKKSRASFNRYYKSAKIVARKGIEGEVIKTIMRNGLVETVNTVKVDKETGERDWVIKNPSGEEYIVTNNNFVKRYEVLNQDTEIFNTYNSKKIEITAVQILEDVSFTAPWGSEMNIEAGSYLVVDKVNGIYGVKIEEFYKTYERIDDVIYQPSK